MRKLTVIAGIKQFLKDYAFFLSKSRLNQILSIINHEPGRDK